MLLSFSHLQNCMSSFLDSLINSMKLSDTPPTASDLGGMTQNAALITETDLHRLVRYLWKTIQKIMVSNLVTCCSVVCSIVRTCNQNHIIDLGDILHKSSSVLALVVKFHYFVNLFCCTLLRKVQYADMAVNYSGAVK